MSSREQRRAWVSSKLVAGEFGVAEASRLSGLSERSIRRLRGRLERDGPAGLVHGNRGRVSAQRVPEATRARIIDLVEQTYHDVNDTHLWELLTEREGITVSRVSVRRLLRGAGRAPQRRRRAPRHRSRRDRMPRQGLLLPTDGSRHDRLGDRGP